MSMAVAVLGSAEGLEESNGLARALGKALAKEGFTIATGSNSGLPIQAAMAAKKEGALLINFSPFEGPKLDSNGLRKRKPENEIFDFIVYTGSGIKGRNVILVRSVDAVAMVGGGFGTLNEFTIAHDEGRIIGVLEGSGGTSDLVKGVIRRLEGTKATIIYSKKPSALAKELKKMVKRELKLGKASV